MTDYPKIAARFARDTQHREMTVLHDDGLYRHLRFAANKDGACWFDLITAPYTLIFKGGGDAYVFTIDATEDMFNLFRRTARPGEINPGYWSEKLRSSRAAATTYSDDLFEKHVAGELKAAEPIHPGVTQAWKDHVESEYNTDFEEEARRALDEFEFGEQYKAHCSECGEHLTSESHTGAVLWLSRHRRERGAKHLGSVEDLAFHFTDTWEWDLQDFDWWFLWACHGIRWGIDQYDAARKPAEAAA
ncbi:hypothetical protein [Streptomyces sp. AA1529]|uniref:hypothetical protein n=1 Tax=Streptomyces sp. AA1529 TaxID=1203257 RepID=UPI0002E6E3B4|nr:hypothetical protein [Streptomyces sp. AA1529]